MRMLNKVWHMFQYFIKMVLGKILKIVGITWQSEQWDKFMQFVKFCMVGLSSAVVMYISYLVTLYLLKNYFIANVVGFIFSTSNSFLWNSRVVFAAKKMTWKNTLISYLKTIAIYAMTGLVISNLLLYLWVDMCGISELIAPIINVLIVTPLNFILNKIWAFQKKEK